jgi:hypothetical protein
MRRRYAVVAGIALGLVGSFLGFATVARTAPSPPPGPPIGPEMPKDTGAGEYLVAVVGGVYATEAEAEAANAQIALGDLQGYYVVSVEQFDGLAGQVGAKDGFALVSMFRSEKGAEEFASLVRTFGFPATIVTQRVKSYGGEYAGLGQEASPDGSGPILGPISESLRAPAAP